MRVVDQTLPTNGGARLLEINTHYDLHLAGQLFAKRIQLSGVLQRPCHIMNRARSRHHQQPRVLLLEDASNRIAAPNDRGAGRLGHRQFRFQSARWREPNDLPYMQVLG